ncbi:ABC transporter substrate-binding protein [Treponema sp.]|uniref:ABC transporter substrate-binding protein n=1 Tax=Treponema sp. TaxID=166 RepID=UPI00388E2911
MLKKIVLILINLSFLHLYAQSASIRLGVQKGIFCAPCAYLIENKEKLAVQNMSFKILDSEQDTLLKLLRGEIDAGFLSSKTAAKVFNLKNDSITALGVCQNGNIFLITNDSSYKSLQDLKGKKVFAASSYSTEARIFQYILSKENITTDSSEESVNIDFSVPAANIPNKLITNEIQFALLTEPFASVAQLNSSEIRYAENISKIYSESENSPNFPAVLLVCRTEFAGNNRALLQKFITVYKSAVSWVNKNPLKTASLIEKHNLGLSYQTAQKAVQNASLVWRDAGNAKPDFEKFYSIINAEIPDEKFYFKN